METHSKEAKPLIIPVFIPNAGCGHRCVFCDQSAVTGKAPASSQKLLAHAQEQIETFLTYPTRKKGFTEIAFYGGTFLGLPRESLQGLLRLAQGYVEKGLAEGIRFSTRPDTVKEETLALLKGFTVTTVELGVQSLDDAVLTACNRGHTRQDALKAAQAVKNRGYKLGLQMMIGLPGQDAASAIKTAREVIGMKPAFTRIYPTVVLKGTRLFHLYKKGAYTPLSLEAALSLTKELYGLFTEAEIKVIRMGLPASMGLDRGHVAAGPYHPAFGHKVLCLWFLDKARKALRQAEGPEAELVTAPENISRLRGDKNENIALLKKEFGLTDIRVTSEPGLDSQAVSLKTQINGKKK